jgi:hypothetical protein
MLIFIPIINSYLEIREHTLIPGVKKVSVYSKDKSDKILEFYIDERRNTIRLRDTLEKKFENSIFNQITKYYNLMKKSDISYGNIETSVDIEYEPVKNILIEDFINFLKQESRNQIIDRIINYNLYIDKNKI